jgi:hypothetical protein
MMFRFALAASIIAMVGTSVWAQTIGSVPTEYQAEEMMKLCRGEVTGANPSSQSLICTFRLQGVGDMMSQNCASVIEGFEPHPRLSARIEASRGAVRQAFLNYMDAHPEEWGDYWANVVSNALSETFPCSF